MAEFYGNGKYLTMKLGCHEAAFENFIANRAVFITSKFFLIFRMDICRKCRITTVEYDVFRIAGDYAVCDTNKIPFCEKSFN